MKRYTSLQGVGNPGAELTALRSALGKGADERLTYGQIARSLAAAKVPRTVIREWMLGDLVSVESAAALRQHLRKLDEPKRCATAKGTTQADKVIDLDTPELGDVITPM